MTAIAAPIGATTVGFTISPTRMTATPAANGDEKLVPAKMRPFPVLRFVHRASPNWLTTSGFNPRLDSRVNDVTNGATGENSD